MSKSLTQRQALALDTIRESIAKRGFPPTMREIARVLGIKSTNGVSDHLTALERKGHIRRTPTARGLEIVSQRDDDAARELLIKAARCAPIEAVRAALDALPPPKENP